MVPDMTTTTGDLKGLLPVGAQIEKLAGGFGFLEGPVWTNEGGGYLIFSDIPRHELKKCANRDQVTTFRDGRMVRVEYFAEWDEALEAARA